MEIVRKLFIAGGTFLVSITVALADVIVDNQVINEQNIQSITISPVTGDVFITTKSSWEVTLTQSDGEPTSGDQVAITSFGVSSNTVLVGESVTFTWTTVNASSCEFRSSLGLVETVTAIASGSKQVTFLDVGSVDFNLICEGDGGPVTAIQTVTVSEPPPDSNCPQPTLSGAVRHWDGLFREPFPGPKSQYVLQSIPKRGYLAVRFDVGSTVSDTGSFSTIESTRSAGTRIGTIAECPGVFNVEDSRCNYTWGLSGGIVWSTNGWPTGCPLEPGKTYYVNVTFTDGVDPLSDTCTESSCYTEFRVSNPD